MNLSFDQARAYYAYRLNMQSPPSRDAFMWRCPFHGDRTASLSVSLAKGVWNCHAGCGSGGIYDFEKTMFPDRTADENWENIEKIAGVVKEKRSNPERGPLLATYEYTDPAGRLLFQKLRYAPKTFVQRVPKGSGWGYSLEGVRKPLYRLSSLIRATVIFVSEGEKDADTLSALDWSQIPEFSRPEYVYAATCNFDGAGKWKEEYSPFFAGKFAILFEDNDEPGRTHVEQVARSIAKYAESVKIVKFPELPEHGDVSDFLLSHTQQELAERIKQAPKWQAPAEETKEETPFFVASSAIRPESGHEVNWLIPGVIHQGGKGMIVAAPKAGKSMIALDLAVALASRQSWCGFSRGQSPIRCGVISREDSPDMAYRRITEFAKGRGIPLGSLDNMLRFNTYHQRRAFSVQNEQHIADVIKWIKRDQIQFCIFDVLNILHSADENSNTEMTKIMKAFDMIRIESGAQVTVIHHTAANHAASRPRGAGAIDSWWDWKMSIAPTQADESIKDVQFFTKAGRPIAPMQVVFRDCEEGAVRIEPVKL